MYARTADSDHDRPLRILFFPRETFPTDRVRLTTLFGRELLSRGHKIDLVMQANDAATRSGCHEWFGGRIFVGATVAGRGPLHGLRRAWLSLLHDLRMLRCADATAYDCILVSDKFLLGSIASIVARSRGQPFLFWLTYPYHEAQLALGRDRVTRYRLLNLLRGHAAGAVLNRWIIKRCDHLFVQSARMATDFAAMGVAPDRMTPIVTGLDLDGVEPIEDAGRRLDPSNLTVGYLGTLVRQRRPEILVDMLSELRRHGVKARLLLVGDGAKPEDRHVIEDRARQLGLLACVEITGQLPRRAALERIKSADVCISPFRPSAALDVASPTKLVEYMALGLPVVANEHPDQTLVLKESRAGVVVPWGARHFARGVRWIAARSPDALDAMSRRGREWVRTHRSYTRIADDFERGCHKAIAAKRSSPQDGCSTP